ncbi:hypothetical protein ACC692_36880, partial [Rhizobium ruizarguesonis]
MAASYRLVDLFAVSSALCFPRQFRHSIVRTDGMGGMVIPPIMMQRSPLRVERVENAVFGLLALADDELMRIGAPFGRYFGLAKLGIHHERLPPG